MMGTIGGIGIVIGIAGLLGAVEDGVDFLVCLGFIVLGVFFVWCEAETQKDNQKRHENDYGKITKCPKCNSTKVYAMTYDDKRDSINFWGAHSQKIGKRYHCDNCGNEW